MRRWLYSLAACAGLLCGLTGCHCTVGVCDCDLDEDPCCARAPWFRPAPYGNGEVIQQLPNKLDR